MAPSFVIPWAQNPSREAVLYEDQYSTDIEIRLHPPGHGVMGKQKPEAEDGLGEDVKDGVGHDLSIDIDVAGAISNTPDAMNC